MPEMVLTWLLRNLHAQGILHVINGIVVGKPAVEERKESYKEVYRQVVAGSIRLLYMNFTALPLNM